MSWKLGKVSRGIKISKTEEKSLVRVRLNGRVIDEYHEPEILDDRFKASFVINDIYKKHPELKETEWYDTDVFPDFDGGWVMIFYFSNGEYDEDNE